MTRAVIVGAGREQVAERGGRERWLRPCDRPGMTGARRREGAVRFATGSAGPLSCWNRYHDESSRGEGREQKPSFQIYDTDETAEEDRGDNPRYLTC